MSRIPDGMLRSAQEALSRARHIGASFSVDHLRMGMMPEDALNEMVDHHLATSLVPYVVEMASRGELVTKQEFQAPDGLSTTFRADVVAMSAADYSLLCKLLRHMQSLNAETNHEQAAT